MRLKREVDHAQIRPRMSLNRDEQLVSDYVESHPEERRYWVDKVQAVARAEDDAFAAANLLADALSDYFLERAAVVPQFRELAARQGLRRTSMRNLAEYWLRLWVAPRPKRKPDDRAPD